MIQKSLGEKEGRQLADYKNTVDNKTLDEDTKNETVPCFEREKVSCPQVQKENSQSEALQRFQKQQATNLQIKEAMAKELASMELPTNAIDQILHIEDEPPF